MKTIKYFATLLMLFTLSVNMNAQALTKAQEKAIKKQVKEFQKDGWKIKPGSLSLADQITRSNQAQWEQDADGYDKWIIRSTMQPGHRLLPLHRVRFLADSRPT